MDTIITNWLYLVMMISLVYFIIIGGMYLFPNMNTLFISIIAMVIIYYLTSQKFLFLMI